MVKASGNEYLSSIEESIVSLINFIRQGNIVDETEECIHESDVSWWNENDKYCLYLNTEEKGNKSFETKDNFDLSSTYTMHMGRDNSNVFYALEYLRFLEQTGHPFRLQNVTNTKGLHSTVKLLAPYYPHWCLMQILIAQDNKHIDLMFGRVKLYELSQKEVDDIAKEYLRIFQIVMKNVKNIDLSETEKEKVYAYFEALSELYKNSIAIDMIEACFVDDSKFYFEDFQNKIWLSNEQELGLIKDFYDVLYINDFKLQNNDMLLKCSNMLFRISIYRVISSEILHNMAALKLCYAIIKNEIVLKTEIQTLLVCLLKLQDETVIKQTDSEQEALYKLRCRIISCKIAKELYVRGIKSDIVDGWKRISENKNEFIEIRNVVFDTTGDE